MAQANEAKSNQYEIARRREKVFAFSTILDRALRQMGIDPDSALAAEKVERLTDSDYEILRGFANLELPEGAKLFGTPSPEAREQFRELYRARCRTLRAVAAFDGRPMGEWSDGKADRS